MIKKILISLSKTYLITKFLMKIIEIMKCNKITKNNLEIRKVSSEIRIVRVKSQI